MKYIQFKKKFYGIIALSIFLLIIIPIKSANGVGLVNYVGGRITLVTYCTCFYDPGVVINISVPYTGQQIMLFYSPFLSRLYSNYNIWHPGPNVIASYNLGPHPCQQTTGITACAPGGPVAIGTIQMIGTSVQ